MSVLTAFCAASCAGRAPSSHTVRTPSPVGTLLIDAKGVTMPVGLATRTLVFTPFFPPGQILQAAVIPPLNVDQQRNHGLALEYTSRGSVLLLSQWPRAGFSIPPEALAAGPCVPVAYKKDGVLWSTRYNVVMTLQPDGRVPASRIRREAQALLGAGACEQPARTPRRSPPRPAASSPRR
ncbi:MAG TPA: hypothetical protein VFA29_04260 [Candidatus Baltobacteraceae bacterium]|nr:hypothetical protein [Candidatus Baltobacteraceae bacterium]